MYSSALGTNDSYWKTTCMAIDIFSLSKIRRVRLSFVQMHDKGTTRKEKGDGNQYTRTPNASLYHDG